MKSKSLSRLAFLLAIVLFVSCSKSVLDDDDPSGKVSLRVTTRGQSSGSSEMTVASPVNIWIFDSATGKCVGYKSVAKESVSADFKLPAGAYKVYSVAGADADNYDLPAVAAATPESVVALKSGKGHGDIMSAQGEVVLESGVDSDITLAMKRKVFMLRNITVNDVPDNVASISAVIKPLYENVTIQGGYVGEKGEQTVVMDKGADGKWTKQCNTFLMESVGNAMITFVFKTVDGMTRTFVYQSDKSFEANYKVDLNVNYLAIAEPSLKCLIKGVSWNDDITWTINVREGDMQNEEVGGVVTDESIPAAGTLYKGCYVLKSVTSDISGGVSTVTLLAPKSKDKLVYVDGDNASIKQAIDEAIAELSVDGIKGWRLPTEVEIRDIMENKSEINKNLNALSQELFFTGTSGIYYFVTNDGSIKCMDNYFNIITPKSDKVYKLRPVNTIIFYNK